MPTQRTLKQGDRQWYIVEGEAGAVTFFTQGSFMTGPTRVVDGKKRMAGDLGIHTSADGPSDDMDPRFMDRCEFTKGRGCRYDGFQSGGNLDLLADEGAAALFTHLTTIYTQHFEEKQA